MASTALPAIFFLSGCAALVFENLWFYQAGITFGNSVWASSLVLAGFMGGLALGNALAARLRPGGFRAIRTYGMLELAIALFGFGLVLGMPALTSVLAAVFEPVLSTAWIANPLRLGFAFLLLLVPSTAMGATLPVMVSALYREDPSFGRVLGRLYGWNTLGAVVGALAGDLVLIEAFGVTGTGLFAAGIGLVAATFAFTLSKRFESEVPSKEDQSSAAPVSSTARWLLLAAAIAGFTLLGLEVVWFRFLIHFMFGSSTTFAILLAAVLAGIGSGGLFGGYLATQEGRAQGLLPGFAMLTGAVCIALYLVYPAGTPVEAYGKTTLRAASLMFPVAFLSGVLFTLLGDALKREEERETRAAGLLTLANTTGAMVGPLVTGFVLLPTFGVDRSLQLLAGLYLLMGGAVFAAGARPETAADKIFAAAGGLALVGLVVVFPVGTTLERHLEPVIEPFLGDEETEPVAIREGLTETIIYLEERAFGEPVSHRMLTNGYSMSGTRIEGLRYMKLFVYLPMAIHPDAKHALLISYGVGTTAKALTNTTSLETIDVVDISKDVLEMNDIVYPEEGTLPLDDSRVRVHIEDGRYVLQTTKKQFDLITGEPPPPKMAGIVSLYTREYFDLMRQRLSEGGVVSYWLPAHTLSPEDSKSIIRAFCDVFDDCTLWGAAGLDWILLGTRDGKGPGSTDQFVRQWRDPVVAPDLKALGIELPEQMGALFMAGPEYLGSLTRDAEPLTDDRPKRLSDRRFDVHTGVKTYLTWLDPTSARLRFERSPWIAEVWPPELKEPTTRYFEAQWDANVVLISTQANELAAVLPKVRTYLTESRLVTLPLWLLGSDALRQAAAKSAQAKGSSKASVFYELGLGALADRQYGPAYQLFTQAIQAGGRGPDVAPLTLYSLFMANDEGGRRTVIQQLESAERSNLPPWFIPFLRQSAAAP